VIEITTSKENTIENKLRKLKETYAKKLPQKIRELKSLWKKGFLDEVETSLLQNLYEEVHKLTGSGSTFGFKEISRCAYQFEKALHAFLERGNQSGPELQVLMTGLFNALKEAVSGENTGQKPPSIASLLETSPEELASSESAKASSQAPFTGVHFVESDLDEREPSWFENVKAVTPRETEPFEVLHLDKDVVLLVEDDLLLAQALEVQLGRYFSCVHCTDGEEALNVLEDINPSLILLDVVLPGMDGYEICRQIREKRNFEDTPILFLTALGNDDEMLAAYDAGADDYLTKPVNFGVLLAKARRFIKRSKKQVRRSDLFKSGAFFAGSYEIKRLLGAGGMAKVFLVRDIRNGEVRALKVLHLKKERKSETSLARFEQEVNTLKRLQHDNLIQFYQGGIYEGLHYYVMNYVDGGSLALEIERFGALEIPQALYIIAEIGEALHYAHSSGVLHRDVKSENILLTKGGKPILTDFGVSLDLQSSQRLTDDGYIVGTPYCMSPEQIQNPKKITPRSDVYGMAVLFFEMVTGRLPAGEVSKMEAFIFTVKEKFPSPKLYNDKLPDEVADFCLKGAAFAPEDRFQSALEMAQVAKALIQQFYT